MQRTVKVGEYWIVTIDNSKKQVVEIGDKIVYPCGDEQGYYRDQHEIVFIRKVRL